ncbi:phytoene desaturase family protein [Acidianus manzaensis]|uniref:Phytoene desaturase n=1 Tax=Acidianus manzaensis TaxID=282676 RepID=A0A1W6JZB8_9CREN|nr:NAD(P)/FAD-dependent oxidoreductase [Acidianus manzaensis]ARM75587.1 phytoene desaturase [Acidianus manzaensis]
MKAIVVGAGIGGMSTALLLAKKGIEVLVIEKLDQPGGRARSFNNDIFSFDMGPSWYLMPEIFNDFFKEIGESTYPTIEVKPKLRLIRDMQGFVESITDEEIPEDKAFDEYLQDTKLLYELSLKKFLYKELKFTDFLDKDLISNLNKFPIFLNLENFNRKYFKTDIMQKLMGFSSVFLGGSPYDIPSIYSMVNYSVFGEGVFYPKNGFSGYVKNLFEICKKVGIEFKFNSPVDKIKINNENKVECVGVKDQCFNGDLFIINMDYIYADSLLPYEYRNNWSKKRLAPSAILGYLGVEGEVDYPHHTVVINGDWKNHFNSILEGNLPDPKNMSYYVSYRKATDRELEGKDLVFLIPISPIEINREDAEKLVRASINDFLEKTKTQFKIKYQRIYTPSDFKTDYNAYRGTAFGLAHTLNQTGPFRPPMKHRKLKNLYYVGQYTQPGIGVPMVTLSSIIVSKRIENEL